MSKETVTQVISKALTDSAFRDQLFADPGKALDSYELTEGERTALNGLKREEFDAFANDIEQRISKVGLTMGGIRPEIQSEMISRFINPQPEPPGIRDLFNLNK